MKSKYLSLVLLSAAALSSCSDDFLQEKKNYEQTDVNAYNSYVGSLGRLADCYMLSLPDVNGNPGWQYTSTGKSDDLSKCTEEYYGFGIFVNPEKELSAISGNVVPDYFQGDASNIRASAWGRIRNINDCIQGISNSTLSQEQKNELLGQAYFLRAWCYYLLVKWYGGVPIITEVQPPLATSVTPRSTTKQCIEFICSDLDHSAELLKPFTTKGGWSTGEYGRVTSGTALALKGRVLLLWASPLFNRENKEERWQHAYETMKADLPIIESCGYGLAYENNPGTNASNWAKMFVEDGVNKEAVFVVLYNNKASGGVPDLHHNNPWERSIRPANTLASASSTPSSNIVALFPMADGHRPASYDSYKTLPASSTYDYDKAHPYMNRDPRFYRTFAFTGVRWRYDGNPMNSNNNIPYQGNNYDLWSYVWYLTDEARNNIVDGKTYGTDDLLDKAKGMYIRKRSDDAELGSARYVFNTDQNGFGLSAAPYMEIRFAEVLLNLAEAACQSGHPADAIEILKRIRSRVYNDKENCGIESNLSDAQCMAAILYERQIEFAFEGKRFDDLRRWMLFDGGVNIPAGAPSSWRLTGWGGNTCDYLGFTPLNGTRRERIEYRVKADYNGGLGADKWVVKGNERINPDPLADVKRPAAINLNEGNANKLNQAFTALNTFYDTYLERNDRPGDGLTSAHTELYINFLPRYYILGFGKSMENNRELPQNIGWDDLNSGAPGTFDPLAE
ncbi:RagB/SusD family nutrient uptake outer membrane protein [uncultured Duncaniella sp.]|mgnify:FL=1|uniref:RagB/SusD family nutrient uptake outer membrane protein n=1 Tax=uncultured Duncaniella sp. TaxID=2768039 RepID=UPI00259FE643|nr:RagB/SusD family nutrient uptake outer membrane protein [uncultured Duncaniella sp.]